jgi:DNA-binding MarR family transcriptional regulator
MTTPPTLGTLLRHLIELLDGAVEQSYRDAGLNYRARYTPVVRALLAGEPISIRTISERARITHSAASQTVALMASNGLVQVLAGKDARERVVALSPAARALLPTLERHWRATESAARQLEREIDAPVAAILMSAIEALDRRSFGERIGDNIHKEKSN